MNAKVKQLWLAALRGGEYVQGKHSLHVDSAFCCLGVLCDLHQKTTGKGQWFKSGTDSSQLYKDEDGAYSKVSLPAGVMKWAGLVRDESKTSPGALADMNDRGDSFLMIADVIEKKMVSRANP